MESTSSGRQKCRLTKIWISALSDAVTDRDLKHPGVWPNGPRLSIIGRKRSQSAGAPVEISAYRVIKVRFSVRTGQLSRPMSYSHGSDAPNWTLSSIQLQAIPDENAKTVRLMAWLATTRWQYITCVWPVP
jgi:hypothetical protein